VASGKARWPSFSKAATIRGPSWAGVQVVFRQSGLGRGDKDHLTLILQKQAGGFSPHGVDALLTIRSSNSFLVAAVPKALLILQKVLK
jgi:hypothetical protein